MKDQIVAVYERQSTLWKNANGFYHAQDWTKMECIVRDYTEEIEPFKSGEMKFINSKGEDCTETEIERRYGKPFVVIFTNRRRTNSKCYYFKTKDEANQFVKSVLNDKILGNFRRIK